MGTLISKLEEIESLDFKPFPTRPTGVGKIVRVEGSLFATALKSDRVIYTTATISRQAAFLRSDWPWLPTVLKALVRLNVVSPSVAKKHKEDSERVAKMSEARHELEYLLDRLEREYDLKLTAAQIKKIEQVAETGEVA